MAIVQVEGLSSYWQGFGSMLPFPDFRESARSMAYGALRTCARTIETVYELLTAFPDGIPKNLPDADEALVAEPEALATIVNYTHGIQRFRKDAIWFALWREYPAAFAAYGCEIHKALAEHCKKDAGSTGLMWADYRERCERGLARELRPGFKYTPAIARKWAAQIPWLGDNRLHAAHRKYLMHSLPLWYRQYGWKDPAIVVRTAPEHAWQRDVLTYKLWFPDSVVDFATLQVTRLNGVLAARQEARR
jgi:hypothetical protein